MADEDEGEGGGGGGKKIIIIIVAVLLLIGIGVGVYLMFFQPKDEEQELAEAEAAISKAAEPLENPMFIPLGTYIANLRDGRRYIKTTIQLMVSEEKVVEYLNLRLVEVKDIVNTELQNLSVEDTKLPGGREELKQKLISKISELFPRKPDWDDPDPIKKVLFEEFYVQ